MAEHKMRDNTGEWFGSIPVDWTILALKYAFSIKKDIAGKLGYTVLSVTQKGIKPKDMLEKGQFAMDYSKYQVVNRGEFIMNHMDLLTGWVDIAQESGVTSPDYRVFYNTDPTRFFSEYYKYIFQFCYSNRVFYGMGQGVAGFGRWRLPSDMFLRFLLPVPQIDEQKAIATYLDEQCTLIDEAIAEAKASIAEYNSWKQSIIFEAVTKGINPNVEMKESRIDWIGCMPSHWNVLPLKYLCTMQAGKNLTSEQICETGQFPVYGGNGIRGYYSQSNYCGDYLLVGRQGALCGNVHKVTGNFWATEHAVVTQNTERITLEFLFYLLLGMKLNQYASNSAAQPGLSVGTIQNLIAAIPPIDEQRKIASYLEEKSHSIDKVIDEKQSLIGDLETYKRSLIYEVVTGKRKVE